MTTQQPLKTQFRTANEQQLDSMNRELRFYPVQNNRPQILSNEQIKQFNEKGYVKGFTLFTGEQANAQRVYFDSILTKMAAAGFDSYSINGFHNWCRGIYDIVVNPVLLDHVQDILGPNFVAWGSHYFCKMPGDGKAVTWHQDASYWPLTPSKTVTVWLAIDDADRENATMKVIPGSHLHGALPFKESQIEENNVLWQTVHEAEKYGDAPVHFEMKAGQFSLHSDLLLHGSDINKSNRRRCALTIRYASVDVRAADDWRKRVIVARGSDPTGHWHSITPPVGDTVPPPDYHGKKK